MTLPAAAEAVLAVWFDGEAPQKRWFARDEAFDAELRSRFADDLARAAHGELGAWCVAPRGALAFIVLCDQLSRNVFRGSARAFALDPLARHVALTGIARGDLAALNLVQRVFHCMPLMHSESLALHDVAHREFAAIVEAAERTRPELVSYAKTTAGYEEKHRAIVERFGRYPHRNALLGRVSTPEEVAFLAEPGSSF